MILCRFLRDGLVVHRKREHDVGPNFPGMQRSIESPEFHCVVAVEETVQIQEMVAAVVVMIATVPGITFIPDTFNL